MSKMDNTIIIEAIDKAIRHKARFYAYRLPGEEQLHFGAQIIDQRTPIGFMIAPFVEKPDCMPYFISAQFDAEKYMKLPVSSLPVTSLHKVAVESTTKDDYMQAAERCIEAMRGGELQKVVLSRVIVDEFNRSLTWTEVFERLLDRCPDSFVFVFNSEATGAWMGASPERYLSYDGSRLRTMALAGTRLAGATGDWGAKEITEQAIVADYIAGKFTDMKMEYERSPLGVRQAVNVEHLCTEFTGTVSRPSQVDGMRNTLHPTPALGGMPVKAAVKFIGEVEGHSRRYYGGYIGPVDSQGHFELFVNVRSLEFDGERYCIYVGGGLTADSVPGQEWDETCDKAALLLGALNA